MTPADHESDIDPVSLRGLLLDQVRNAIIMTDFSGSVVLWNAHATEMFGWTAEEAIGRDVGELTMGSKDVELPGRIIGQVTAGEAWQGEFRGARKDGTSFDAHVSSSLVRDASGRPLGIVGVTADLTPMKMAGSEASREAELARVVFDTLNMASAVLDVNGTIRAVNRAWLDFAELHGTDPARVGVGADYIAVCRADSATTGAHEVADRIMGALVDGGRYTVGYESRIGPSTRSFSCEIAPLPGEGCVVHYRDVTAEVEVRDGLRRLAEAKDRFVATVSHELRTPLTAVLGLGEELVSSDDLDKAQVAELLEIIVEQARDASALVEDLLVVARLESDALAVHVEAVDVGDVVRSVVRPFLTSGTAISLGSGDAIVMALADKGRLRQVLRNLITNALRYGRPPFGVDVKCEEEVSIVVTDHGGGIPPHQVQAVFELFGRGEGANRDPESVGIGLAVAKALAERMGGELRYHRDARTAFTLTLPKAPD